MKNIKTNIPRYFRGVLTLALGVTLMGACSDSDKDDNPGGPSTGDNDTPKTVSIYGLDDPYPTAAVKLWGEETGSSPQISLLLTYPVTGDQTVTFGIDESKVAEYNAQKGTNYQALPSEAFLPYDVTILDRRLNTYYFPLQVQLKPGVIEDGTYLAAITIIDSSSDYITADPDASTYYMLVTYRNNLDPETVNALDLSNYEMYSNYIFSSGVTLSNYTIELKFKVNDFSANKMRRLANFTDSNESRNNMLRIGADDAANNQMQWICPSGTKLYSSTRFQAGEWYHIALTFDGSNYRMYIDQSLDANTRGTTVPTFQRLEVGMSWGGYGEAQHFNGSVRDVRIWNKALSVSDLVDGLCGVDGSSDGLVGYWKLDEGTGYIFHDSSASGQLGNIDWSDTYRDYDESGRLTAFDYSSEVRWITDQVLCW